MLLSLDIAKAFLNMPAATQDYLSARTYDPANMFATAGRCVPKSNDFFKMFENGVSNDSTIAPQQSSEDIPRAGNMETLNTDENGMFDFDPPVNSGTPFRDQFSTPGASGMPWANEPNFHPLSPPDSASFSPKNPWAYPYPPQNPANIFTNIDPANTRAHYGQVTPPDDETDSKSLLDFPISGQNQRRLQPQEANSPAKKRKRNGSTNNEQAPQTTKRSRKYATRGSSTTEANDKPEDEKRSKFLERNRVAASKCRQKKKEWTQNLENRARELQKNNNLLRMEVESLRQETLFLKGEMLKHSSCDCEQIQIFMKSESNNFLEGTDDGIVLKREQSPIESMPGSPKSRRHSNQSNLDEASAAAEQTDTSIVNDESALEALLSNSIHHDTSNDSIDAQVTG